MLYWKLTKALAKQLTKLTKHTVHIAIKLIVIIQITIVPEQSIKRVRTKFVISDSEVFDYLSLK